MSTFIQYNNNKFIVESDNRKGGSCSCFLMIFHVKIHGILILEQNIKSLN